MFQWHRDDVLAIFTAQAIESAAPVASAETKSEPASEPVASDDAAHGLAVERLLNENGLNRPRILAPTSLLIMVVTSMPLSWVA